MTIAKKKKNAQSDFPSYLKAVTRNRHTHTNRTGLPHTVVCRVFEAIQFYQAAAAVVYGDPV